MALKVRLPATCSEPGLVREPPPPTRCRRSSAKPIAEAVPQWLVRQRGHPGWTGERESQRRQLSAAVVMSPVQCAKLHGQDRYRYLEDVFECLRHNPSAVSTICCRTGIWRRRRALLRIPLLGNALKVIE